MALKQVTESVWSTGIDGLYYIERLKYDDERGFFREVANIKELEGVIGHGFCPVQVNHSRSNQNVTRGIHAEGWNKLVTVVQGTAFCAYADVRPGSKTFGKIESIVLGIGEGAKPGAIYLEKGIGNSLCVIGGPMDYVYVVDALYADRDKAKDRAISVFDEDLAIKWPIAKEKMILSERDKQTVTLRELLPEKFK